MSFISKIQRTLVGGEERNHHPLGPQSGFTDYRYNISCYLEEIRHLARRLTHDKQSMVVIVTTDTTVTITIYRRKR